MPKKYTIRDGFSFIDDNSEVKAGGEIIELDDDVAAQHLHKLDVVVEEAPAKKAELPTSYSAHPAAGE